MNAHTAHCGCKVGWVGGNLVVGWCALHANADELLKVSKKALLGMEAIHEALLMMSPNHSCDLCQTTMPAMREAIRKAEGG